MIAWALVYFNYAKMQNVHEKIFVNCEHEQIWLYKTYTGFRLEYAILNQAKVKLTCQEPMIGLLAFTW